MKTQICTTVEQSNRLLAVGMNPGTTTLYWIKRYDWDEDYFLTNYAKDFLSHPAVSIIPAWDMATLLEMMPKRIKHEFYDFYILKSDMEYVIVKYSCGNHLAIQFHRESIFDAMIDMIEWLIKNGHFDKKWLGEKGGDE